MWWCGVVWCGVVWCGVVWCTVAVHMFVCESTGSTAPLVRMCVS